MLPEGKVKEWDALAKIHEQEDELAEQLEEKVEDILHENDDIFVENHVRDDTWSLSQNAIAFS
jgi:hypothetical protein